MAQRTAKTIVEVLTWLHENDHHEVGVEQPKETHAYYKNYHDILRVPIPLIVQCQPYFRPNRRKFDTRMFALTAAGRRLIGATGV